LIENLNCEAHFSKNITRDKHGRYMVPFKDHKQLGELRTAVFKRLYSLECKLKPRLEDSLFTNYSRILHGLKSPGIFNENKRFLGKVIFILQQIVIFEGNTWFSDTLGIAIFQHFDAFSVVKNVQAFEIRLGFRDDFLI